VAGWWGSYRWGFIHSDVMIPHPATRRLPPQTVPGEPARGLRRLSGAAVRTFRNGCILAAHPLQGARLPRPLLAVVLLEQHVKGKAALLHRKPRLAGRGGAGKKAVGAAQRGAQELRRRRQQAAQVVPGRRGGAQVGHSVRWVGGSCAGLSSVGVVGVSRRYNRGRRPGKDQRCTWVGAERRVGREKRDGAIELQGAKERAHLSPASIRPQSLLEGASGPWACCRQPGSCSGDSGHWG
jgi:hypothetical protein